MALLQATLLHQLYDPLKQSKREIRLIHLKKSNRRTDPIRCEIKTVSLDERPSFQALSYVWGEKTDTRPIIVSDTKVRVTANLFLALSHIRKDSDDVVLWIDALCINQADVFERNHQVQLMRSIFSNATKVIAWLGPASNSSLDDTKLAFNVLRRISEAAVGYEKGDFILVNQLPELYRPIHPKPKSRPGSVSRALSYQHISWRCVWSLLISPSTWRYRVGVSMSSLFSRDYWTRVWILQEFALASDLLIMCGIHSIEPSTLVPFLEMIKREYPKIKHNDALTRGDWWQNASTMMDFRRSSKSVEDDLFSLVEKTAKFSASDPRDKIIGLLGLSNFDILPDYDLSTGTFYWNFAIKWIEERNNLSILIPAELSDYGKSRSRQGLPSWVPDWEHLNLTVIDSSDHMSRYQAAGIRVSNIQLVQDEKVLRVSGIYCCKVVELGPDMARYKINGLRNFREFCTDYLLGDNREMYPTGIARVDAFAQLILNEVDLIESKPLDTESPIYHALARHLYSDIFHENTTEFRTITESLRLCLNQSSPNVYGTPSLASNEQGLGDSIVIPKEKIYDHMDNWNRNRRVFIMEDEYLGIGPEGMKADDEICILYGLNMPVVLRPKEGQKTFVGFCFVLGLMNGEATAQFSDSEQMFDIA
jgi:Heterokaryon incompatibility protein (HET)